MAPPRAGGPRRSQVNEHLYTLGERGRKTGVTLRDTGVRDEHGMQPIDDLFSSPSKSHDGDATGAYDNDEEEEEEEEEEEDDDDDDDNGEVDMELTNVVGPGPAALLNGQGAAARGTKSPARTLFGSPAVRAAAGSAAKRQSAAIRQNHLLKPPSSPSAKALAAHGLSPVKTVNRRLDFGKTTSANAQRKPLLFPNGSKNSAVPSLPPQTDEDDEDEENILHGTPLNGADDSMQMIDEPDAFDNTALDEPEEEAEEEEEEEPVRAPQRRGRPPKAKAAPPPTKPAGTKRRRSGRDSGVSEDAPADPEEEEEEEEEEQQAKRQKVAEPKARGRPRGRPPANKAAAPPEPAEDEEEAQEEPEPAKKPAGPQKRGRKRKSSGVGAATAAAAAVPRGPPLPKSRGLVIKRRNPAAEVDNAIRQTRSGRNSFRPLAYWRNEHVEFDPSEVQDDAFKTGRRFLLPAVKEVVRVEDDEPPPLSSKMGGAGRGRKAGAGGGGGGGRRRGKKTAVGSPNDGPLDYDLDDWEYEPGRLTGEVVLWNPEHELNPPSPTADVAVVPAELAFSGLAIKTQPVRDGSFQFAKMLSLPFFGTGMVDLAPGAVKQQRNSRKMHMAFFVHYGQVSVVVSDNTFRISQGGMWNVPRGNQYSIHNDTDHPARIFFSQGCEILRKEEE